MASELKNYKIEIGTIKDKDKYRDLISSIFFKSKEPAAVDQAGKESESQEKSWNPHKRVTDLGLYNGE